MKKRLLTVGGLGIVLISTMTSSVYANVSNQSMGTVSKKIISARHVKNNKPRNVASEKIDIFTLREEIDQIVGIRNQNIVTRAEFEELSQSTQLADNIGTDILGGDYGIYALNAAKYGFEIIPQHQYHNLVSRSRQEYVLEKLLEDYDYLGLLDILKNRSYDRVITGGEFDILTQKLSHYKQIKKAISENNFQNFTQAIKDYSQISGYAGERTEE